MWIKRKYQLLAIINALIITLFFLNSHTQSNADNSPARGTALITQQFVENTNCAESWELKLDAVARILYTKATVVSTQSTPAVEQIKQSTMIEAKRIFSIEQNDQGEWLIDVFILVDQATDANLLAQTGFEYRTQVDNIVLGRLPIENLPLLAKEPCVKYVETSKKSELQLDASRVEIGANKVHQGYNLPQAYQGEGVIVGVIDSGIDFTHPDFSDANGTRIKYLLEYTNDGGQKEWTKNQIDSNPNSVTERDGNGGSGHGTHVTGIAAGGGQASSSFRGIALKSDIIFVKGVRDPDSNGGYSDVDIVSGCYYIFSRAQELNKPAVINLSLGGQIGAHDGKSLYEQFLSGLTGPGRIIVAAVGNEGDEFIHTGANTIAKKQMLTIIGLNEPLAIADLWYDAGAISFVRMAICYVNPSYELIYYEPNTDWVSVGKSIIEKPIYLKNDHVANVSIDAKTTNDSTNGCGRIMFMIKTVNNANLTQVPIAINVYGEKVGRFDIWINGGYFDSNSYSFSNGVTSIPGDNKRSCGIPATAEKVIAVGSYVTKNSWVDVDGYQWDWPPSGNPSTIKDLSRFSSHGPTRDGRLKPDICAPGELIFSALSSHLTEGQGYQRQLVLPGYKYQGMQGTSQAAPHVTGIVALMLQANPDLDYYDVREKLAETARSDGYTGSTPNYAFGYGKVDALAAVKSVAEDINLINVKEGFDSEQFPPSNWLLIRYADKSKKTWCKGNLTENYSQIDPNSTYSAVCWWDAVEQKEALYSWSFSIAGEKSELEFWSNYNSNFLKQDSVAFDLFLWYKENGNDKWTRIWKASNDGQGRKWRKTVVDLSQYDKSKNYRLCWYYEGLNDVLRGAVAIDGVILRGKFDYFQAIEEMPPKLPQQSELYQNYPNPFNPSTTFVFSLPKSAFVTLKVYNLLGEEVTTLIAEERAAGIHRFNWDANGFASGVYLYRLEAGEFIQTRKLILMR